MGKAKYKGSREQLELLRTSATERKRVFKDLCNHIKAGYSLDCFSTISEITILEWLKVYKDEFIEEDLYNAMREGKQGWESIGRRQSTGECLGNSRAWFYNMAHRYKWSDRVQVESDNKHAVSVNIVSYASQQVPSTSFNTLDT